MTFVVKRTVRRTGTPSADSDLINRIAVAKKLGMSPRTVDRWVKEGILPRVSITPKTFRFYWPQVLQALLKGQGRAT